LNISVIIPLLNEEESLPELFSWIDRVMTAHDYSYEVIAIDDGSRDNSWEVIQAQRRSNPNIKGIRFQRNFGKSAALQCGFQAAQGEVVITMDADLQDSPDEIPGLYKMIKEERYQLVSGWKQKRLDNTFTKNLPSKFFNTVTRRVSGIYNLHDFNCGLKAYEQKVVKNIEVYGEMHRYIPVIAKWAGFTKIGEKVVQHQARKYGTTKFGMDRFINGFLDLMSITFVGRFGKRPMHLFGTLGTLSFLMGFVILLYLTFTKAFFGKVGMTDRPIFYLGILTIVIGVQLFVAGFLGELISRNSPERNHYGISEKTGF
jgi:glycosyltransferase involved in cell wall biosynthesis